MDVDSVNSSSLPSASKQQQRASLPSLFRFSTFYILFFLKLRLQSTAFRLLALDDGDDCDFGASLTKKKDWRLRWTSLLEERGGRPYRHNGSSLFKSTAVRLSLICLDS